MIRLFLISLYVIFSCSQVERETKVQLGKVQVQQITTMHGNNLYAQDRRRTRWDHNQIPHHRVRWWWLHIIFWVESSVFEVYSSTVQHVLKKERERNGQESRIETKSVNQSTWWRHKCIIITVGSAVSAVQYSVAIQRETRKRIWFSEYVFCDSKFRIVFCSEFLIWIMVSLSSQCNNTFNSVRTMTMQEYHRLTKEEQTQVYLPYR